MVVQIMPTITEVLNTCSNDQPESPSCLLSCALRGTLMFREKVLRNHNFVLLPHILSCLLARISFRSVPEKVHCIWTVMFNSQNWTVLDESNFIFHLIYGFALPSTLNP